MRGTALLLVATTCTYQPAKLEVDACQPGCAGECVAGECIVPIGTSCAENTVCANDGSCACADARCSERICAQTDCGPCAFSADGLSCTGSLEDGQPCVPEAVCAAEAACLAGSCITTRDRPCMDDNACTDDLCNPTDGRCQHPPRSNCGLRVFSYHRTWAVFLVGEPIPNLVPIVTPELSPNLTVTVTPDLPDGLDLDPATGIVSGTPLAADFGPDLLYVFTASTGHGDDLSDTFTITVLDGFVVNTSVDSHDQGDDGLCGNGTVCSLRAAVAEIGSDAVTRRVILISPAVAQVDLTLGPIAIPQTITIYGHEWAVARINIGSNGGRAFDVISGDLWLSGVWLKHGRAQGAGAIRVEENATAHLHGVKLEDNWNEAVTPPESDEGGAIHVEGQAFLDYCTGVGNWKLPEGNGPGFLSVAPYGHATITSGIFEGNRGQHGGVFRALNDGGTIWVESSFISDNHAELDPAGDGGVVDAGVGTCQITLINNTMVGNTAKNNGAVIYSTCTNPPVLHHNTMIDNQALNTIYVGNSVAELNNNILANPGPECESSEDVGGAGNLTDDDACALSEAGNRVLRLEAMALLGPGVFGGPTPSMRPDADSPAVNGGAPQQCTLPTDQRGLPRQVDACDVGAVELQ